MYLSIITITLNNISGLKRTMETVLPLPDNCEWIIIDGGSMDGTVDLLGGLEKDHCLVWRSQKDDGIYDAMNKGVKIAIGDYLCFMNAGDAFERSTLLEITDKRMASAEIQVFDFYPIGRNGRSSKALPLAQSAEKLCLRNAVPHQSTLISRTVFQRIGLYATIYKISGDYDFFARAYSQGVKFVFFPGTYLASFRFDGVSSQLRVFRLVARENATIQRIYFGRVNYLRYAGFLARYILSFVPCGVRIVDSLRFILPKRVK